MRQCFCLTFKRFKSFPQFLNELFLRNAEKNKLFETLPFLQKKKCVKKGYGGDFYYNECLFHFSVSCLSVSALRRVTSYNTKGKNLPTWEGKKSPKSFVTNPLRICWVMRLVLLLREIVLINVFRLAWSNTWNYNEIRLENSAYILFWKGYLVGYHCANELLW